MNGILCLLNEEKDKEAYQMYSAQCLWTIAAGLFSMGGQKLDMPQYVELIYPEKQEKKLTAKEIKEQTVKWLREG